MERALASTNIFRFGLFEADSGRGTLTRNGLRVKIQDQPFRVLLLLLEKPGEVVSREELKQRLWPDGTYVDFDGSLNVILKKLRAAIDDDPENPRFIETVPRRGYRFIAPVSVERTSSPNEMASTVASPSPVAVEQSVPVHVLSSETSKAERPSFFRRPLLAFASAALVLLIAMTLYFARWRSKTVSPTTSSLTSPVRMRKSVAVLGFHSLSGKTEDAWLATALSEMLSTELAGGEQLRLVPGEDVANLRIASPWSQTDTLDQATTSRIGTALSSDLLLLGSYVHLGKAERGQLRVDVRLQDSRTGEIITEVAETGSSQELFRLVTRVGSRLRDRMGVPRVEETDQAGILASLPSNPEAARFYALGVAKLRHFDALAAKDLLIQATQAEPKFPLAHTMLARAWGQLGYAQNQRDEAKKALDLARDLPREEHMLVEGEYFESMGNPEQAASMYRALYELFPDNVDYGLRLAHVAILSGNASQALQVLAQLRALPRPASDDPRIDLAESRAIKTNSPAQLVLIRSAVRKASAQGNIPVYAQARKEECMNVIYGTDPQPGVPVCEDAYNLFLAEGNRAGAADCIRLIADKSGGEGHYDEAIATYERALKVLDGLGEHEKTGAILNNMAIDYANEGKLDRADQLYEQAKKHFEQCGDKYNTATTMSNIADILFMQGNLPAAEKAYQETLDVMAPLERGEPGYALYRMADLELAEGKLNDAKMHVQKAIESILPSEGGYQYLTTAMLELGEILELQGDFAGARSQFEQTVAMRQKIGASELLAETQVELAQLSIEEGHPDQAESVLRTAISTFEKEKGDPDAASGYTHLSRALLMQGRLDESRTAAENAVRKSTTSSDPSLVMPAQIQRARVAIAAGVGTGSAVEELRSITLKAKKLGYYVLECEARIALGEAQMKTNPSIAKSQLTAVASDTRARGLELLARHAERTLSGNGIMADLHKPAP